MCVCVGGGEKGGHGAAQVAGCDRCKSCSCTSLQANRQTAEESRHSRHLCQRDGEDALLLLPGLVLQLHPGVDKILVLGMWGLKAYHQGKMRRLAVVKPEPPTAHIREITTTQGCPPLPASTSHATPKDVLQHLAGRDLVLDDYGARLALVVHKIAQPLQGPAQKRKGRATFGGEC